MGFVAQAAKTTKTNLSMLRGKTFFQEIGKAKGERTKSKIDGSRLKQKALLIANRKLNHRLRLALVISLIYLFSVFGVFILKNEVYVEQLLSFLL